MVVHIKLLDLFNDNLPLSFDMQEMGQRVDLLPAPTSGNLGEIWSKKGFKIFEFAFLFVQQPHRYNRYFKRMCGAAM